MSDLGPATCPRCGASISAGGADGLCPRCLASDPQNGHGQDVPVPLTSSKRSRRKRWLALAAVGIGAMVLGGVWIGKGSWRAFEATCHYERGKGLYLLEQGRTDEAITEFRAAIEINPDFAEAHSSLGDALRDLGIECVILVRLRTVPTNLPEEFPSLPISDLSRMAR
jgi:tetratricopeptide (TPR) repeat protein